MLLKLFVALVSVLSLAVGAFASVNVDLTTVASDITAMVQQNLPVILGLLGITFGIPLIVKVLKRVAR